MRVIVLEKPSLFVHQEGWGTYDDKGYHLNFKCPHTDSMWIDRKTKEVHCTACDDEDLTAKQEEEFFWNYDFGGGTR